MSSDLAPPFSIDRYADLLSEGLGVASPDWGAIVTRHGMSASTWERGKAYWIEKLEDGDEDADLNKAFQARLIEALSRSVGYHPPVSLDVYIDLAARSAAGEPLDDALRAHGMTTRTLILAELEWNARGQVDRKLGAYTFLRLKKAYRERTGSAKPSPFEVSIFGPDNLVRARRCPSCGALKALAPTTAFVYCDYCATLFDHDNSFERRDENAIETRESDRVLMRAIEGDLRAALGRGDRAAYAELHTWLVTVAIEISPLGYPPRVKDPEYRARYVRDLIVPWAVAVAFDERARASSVKCTVAHDAAIREPTLARVLELWEVSRASWANEVELLEREGLFARHPDGFDAAMFLHVNASVFVRPWLGVLGEADQERLLRAAGVASEYVRAPQVVFSARGCGQCGANLQVPEGAKRMVCGSCGYILEVADRAFPCDHCGKPLAMPANIRDVVCGSCNARWVR